MSFNVCWITLSSLLGSVWTSFPTFVFTFGFILWPWSEAIVLLRVRTDVAHQLTNQSKLITPKIKTNKSIETEHKPLSLHCTHKELESSSRKDIFHIPAKVLHKFWLQSLFYCCWHYFRLLYLSTALDDSRWHFSSIYPQSMHSKEFWCILWIDSEILHRSFHARTIGT